MTDPVLSEFHIRSSDDARTLDQRLRHWSEETDQYIPDHLSLEVAYNALANRPDHTRIMAALFDLYVTWIFSVLDYMKCFSALRDMNREGASHHSILQSQLAFNCRIASLSFYTSYVLRLRAVWDKLLGLYVLLVEPRAYDDFSRSKSRKTAFKKFASRHDVFPNGFGEKVAHAISILDDEFRTAEAHGTGRLRKHVLAPSNFPDSPEARLLGHYNMMNNVFAILQKVIVSAPVPTTEWMPNQTIEPTR